MADYRLINSTFQVYLNNILPGHAYYLSVCTQTPHPGVHPRHTNTTRRPPNLDKPYRNQRVTQNFKDWHAACGFSAVQRV